MIDYWCFYLSSWLLFFGLVWACIENSTKSLDEFGGGLEGRFRPISGSFPAEFP